LKTGEKPAPLEAGAQETRHKVQGRPKVQEEKAKAPSAKK